MIYVGKLGDVYKHTPATLNLSLKNPKSLILDSGTLDGRVS